MAEIVLNNNIEVAGTLRQLEKDRCASDLAYFIRKAWKHLEPDSKYCEGWHIKMICMHLQAITDGLEKEDGTPYNRLLINVPPGMMKSLLVNVFWPAWEWGPKNKPSTRYLLVSHSLANPIRDAGKLRRLLCSDWYQERWPIHFREDQNAKTYYENTSTGFVAAVASGSITGKRGDRILLDDAMSWEDANSETIRASRIGWFKGALTSRLNSVVRSAIVVIEQRLHQEDISGVILDEQLGYDHIKLPMEYDEANPMGPTLLGVEDPRTEPGELLFPEMFPAMQLARDKKTMSAYECTPYESPITMGDLTQKPIGQVSVGDEIVGFGRKEGGRATLLKATVTEVHKQVAKVVKMTLDSGEVIRCTSTHRWFKKKKENRPQYSPAKIGTELARLCSPHLPKISDEDQRLAGWLSGFFDGEGTINCALNGRVENGVKFRGNTTISFFQGAGRNKPLCDKLEFALEKFGFDFTYSEDERKPNKDAPCYGYRAYRLRSGSAAAFRLIQKFLHIVQPTKWRQRLIDGAYGARFIDGWERVVSIEDDGEEEVYSLTTTTGNYVVWGLLSSNCAGQYQQLPVPKGGGIIDRGWWMPWNDEKYPELDYILASLDTAYGEKQENDFSAMTIWGVYTLSNTAVMAPTRSLDRYGKVQEVERVYAEGAPHIIMMYAWRARLPFHELVQRVLKECKYWKIDRLIVEGKAAGKSVVQEVRRVTSGEEYGIQEIDPGRSDKWQRLHSVSHLWQEGMIHAPDKEWAEMVIQEVEVFPKGKHDDLTDTVSMAAKFLRDNGLLSRAPERLQEIADSMVFHGSGPTALYPG